MAKKKAFELGTTLVSGATLILVLALFFIVLRHIGSTSTHNTSTPIGTYTTTQAPGTTTQAPGTTTQAPGTTTQAPGTTTKAPGTTTKAPGTTTKAPGTTIKAPASTVPGGSGGSGSTVPGGSGGSGSTVPGGSGGSGSTVPPGGSGGSGSTVPGGSGTTPTTTTVAPYTGVRLGSAAPYSVIAGAAFTRGSSNTISGATLWSVAGATSGPWKDASDAYSNASGRTPTYNSGATDIQNNLPLTAGVYRHTSYVSATGTLTLDGQGNPNAVFIFQIGGYLSTEAGFRVVLTNGASADNVFWQVGTYFTPGASTIFKGTVVAGTYITTGAGLDLDGRLFALNAAVTTGASNIIR